MPIKTSVCKCQFSFLFFLAHSFILKVKNMEVTPEALKEFKKIYKDKFGEELSDDDALEMAQRVLTFFSLIYRPLPGQNDLD